MRFPDFITHYNRSEAFRSMTSVALHKRADILKNLNETNTWGLNRFSDSKYLEQRLEIEKQMRLEFISKGGKPELEHPIYFFLGSNQQFEQHELNIAYTIYLKDIPPDSISFTYGDSMLAYNEENRHQSGEKYKNSLCGKLFRLHQLEELFLHKDFPQDAPLHIEAHLWVSPVKEIVKNLKSKS